MNAVEHIVECCFRYVRGCFTMTDVKVPGGNNRQCDLLAYNLRNRRHYHVESSVTHQETCAPSVDQLREIFDRKFRGLPAKREGVRTDYAKGKSYYSNILGTYKSVGLDADLTERIFVIWKWDSQQEINRFLSTYFEETNLQVQVLSFRDQILPELMDSVATNNYDDEVLRTLLLLRQKERQTVKMEG